MTEADCLKFCYDRGFFWNEDNGYGKIVRLYDFLDRCSCWCCQNKNLKELEAIYKYLPNYWEALKKLQSKTDRPMKKSGSVFELEIKFKEKEN